MRKLQAGIGKIDITPPVGIELSGWGFGKSEGVLDNLYATSLILDNGERRILLITADLIGIDERYVKRVREGIKKELGIEEDHVLICASHTHSGPATAFLRKWGKVDENYLEILQEKLIEVAKEASNNMVEARIGVGRGREDKTSCNRRVIGGPIDPEMGVVRIDNREGKMVALLLNFSCHPVTLHGYKNLISPDFIGYIRKMVEKEGATLLYTTGASGDVNPAPEFFKGAGKGDAVLSQKVAELVGVEALRVAEEIKTISEVKIRAESVKARIPLAELPTLDELKKEKRIKKADVEKVKKEKAPYHFLMEAYALLEWTQEAIRTKESSKVEKERIAEIQVIGINNLTLVALPGELFVEIGLDIKKMLSSEYTFIIQLANGAIGYLPTRKAFDESGYESEIAPRFYGLYSLTPEVEQIIKDNVAILAAGR